MRWLRRRTLYAGDPIPEEYEEAFFDWSKWKVSERGDNYEVFYEPLPSSDGRYALILAYYGSRYHLSLAVMEGRRLEPMDIEYSSYRDHECIYGLMKVAKEKGIAIRLKKGEER